MKSAFAYTSSESELLKFGKSWLNAYVSFLDRFAEDTGYCPSTFLVKLLDNNLNHVNNNGKEIDRLKVLNDGAGWRAGFVNNIIKKHNETKATKIDMTNIDVFEFPGV